MSPYSKEDAREAFLKRLKIYWGFRTPHRFLTRIGEIYEVDFGENVGDEFSGRHLGICLADTSASQSRTLVIPLTTKYAKYNIHENDVIHTKASYDGTDIVAGVVLGEARWVSKLRIFPRSIILGEPPDTELPYAKAYIEISKRTLSRWRKL